MVDTLLLRPSLYRLQAREESNEEELTKIGQEI
jgi:hypothetical protein